MGRTSALLFDSILRQHPRRIRPGIFVETGTFEADTTLLACNFFPIVETIELSPVLYHRAVARLAGTGAVCHHGDSAELLPRILARYDEPVFVYLDAHWFDRSVKKKNDPVEEVAGAGQFPLWAELAAVARRRHPDIVVVDDIHAFGRPGEWETVQPVTIERALGRVARAQRFGDHYAVYRHPA